MKNKITLSALFLVIILGSFTVWNSKHITAVTDTCSGVATTFDGAFPASVTAGQTFNLSGITSRPSTSYGVTVTSSTLKLSATNASETTYSKNNTSTSPSPTTGASTYTAYYPNWALTATGSAGSQITIKLVQATAQTSEYGPITCPLTATLATITITAAPPPAPPPPSGGSSGSSGSSTGTTAPTSTTSTDNKPTPTTLPTPASQTTNTQTNTPSTTQQTNVFNTENVLSVTFLVTDSKNNVLQGAEVTLDEIQTVITDIDGEAPFKNITPGEHQVSVLYKNHRIDQTIQVNAQSQNAAIPITVPMKANIVYMIIFALTCAIIVIASVFVAIRLRRKANTLDTHIPLTSLTTMGQSEVSMGSIAPNIITPTVIEPQYPAPQTTQAPQQNISQLPPNPIPLENSVIPADVPPVNINFTPSNPNSVIHPKQLSQTPSIINHTQVTTAVSNPVTPTSTTSTVTPLTIPSSPIQSMPVNIPSSTIKT